jgi:hypothetical protein
LDSQAFAIESAMPQENLIQCRRRCCLAGRRRVLIRNPVGAEPRLARPEIEVNP